MASGTTVVIPSNGANIIQTTPGLPGVVLQATGGISYPMYGAQQLGISPTAPQQVPTKGPWERFLKAEPKVLGAIQIMIGLIHIGFGAISTCLIPPYYVILSGNRGYPFWGGIFFISSGSLCVAAANRPSRALVKSSVGMNITSAVMALIGIILYLCELSFNIIYLSYAQQYHTDSSFSDTVKSDAVESVQNISYGHSVLLLLFSLLEFCIAVSQTHFGCQATCCSDAQPTMVYVSYQVIGGGEVTAEPNPPPPPTYDSVITKSQ